MAERFRPLGMTDILSITGVVFVLISLGLAAVRLDALSLMATKALGQFVVAFALPALIFRAVSSRPLGEIANAVYLGAYLIGSLAVFGLGYLWSRRIAGSTRGASTFRAMGMSCSNSGFIGYPVLLMALPEVASTALALSMIVENLVMIPLVLVLAESASRRGASAGWRGAARVVGRLTRSPILIALVLGVLVSVTGVPVPPLVARPVELLAASSAALSLVAIGGTLATLPLRGLGPSVLLVASGKLILHPLAVGLALLGLAASGVRVGDDRLAAAAVVMAAMPVMSIYPILAQRSGQEREAALAMLGMTVLSFVTITAVLALVLG